MAKYGILLAFLFVGGLAFPVAEDDSPSKSWLVDDEMGIYFDHTMTDSQGRIIGGTTAATGAYPWMVAMIVGNNGNFVCGASIVTARHALTAAHCNRAVAPGGLLNPTLRIVAGTNRWNRGGTRYTLQRFVNHPQYNHNIVKNDIGVLVTSSNIVMTNVVRAIPISYAFVGGNVAARVSGWGLTRNGSGFNSNQLQELRVNTVEGSRCDQLVQQVARQHNMQAPRVDSNVEICTFIAVNQGTCNGDSGSALVHNANNHQIGIVSWGLPCARGAPDVFARISAYANWLPAQLR